MNESVTVNEIRSSFVEMGVPYRRTTNNAALHQSGRHGRVAAL